MRSSSWRRPATARCHTRRRCSAPWPLSATCATRPSAPGITSSPLPGLCTMPLRSRRCSVRPPTPPLPQPAPLFSHLLVWSFLAKCYRDGEVFADSHELHPCFVLRVEGRSRDYGLHQERRPARYETPHLSSVFLKMSLPPSCFNAATTRSDARLHVSVSRFEQSKPRW